MDKQALRDHWALTEADLARARKMLPDHAASEEVIQQYQEFIDHNELQLACDVLETYARDHMVCREFWLALRDAAIRMKLPDWADRYERCAANS